MLYFDPILCKIRTKDSGGGGGSAGEHTHAISDVNGLQNRLTTIEGQLSGLEAALAEV